MNSTEIIASFRVYCGNDKFSRFLSKFQRESRTVYKLWHWQAELVDAFVAQSEAVLSAHEVVEALSDGKEFMFACPTPTCEYIVTCLDRATSQWFCGECGVGWETTAALFTAIQEITARYPYRRQCYIINQDTIEPAPRSQYAPDYSELVRTEWDDARDPN
ncbi:MAG: hypothetical protein HS115_12045 [Spirochaetales bacterium]|nr:hypothetical protein [Spirochaetales bacterium]